MSTLFVKVKRIQYILKLRPDYPKCIVSNQKEESISIQRVDTIMYYLFFRHAEDYETVFTVHGVLGETPRRLSIRGQGSYDGKHEAILNI